jgi:flagellum-specific peptidoglycan hydrolase FlgJ
MNKKDFISKHKQAIIEQTYDTQIFPSVKMAQMIIESGWGENLAVKKANNYFGIKADTSWKGEKVSLPTSKDASKVSSFRKYKSVSDSIKDHNRFLMNNDRYERAGVFEANTPQQQIDAIAKAGYAEDNKYANFLKDVMNDNNLEELDKEAKSYHPPQRIFDKPIDYKAIVLVVLLLGATYVLYKKFK